MSQNMVKRGQVNKSSALGPLSHNMQVSLGSDNYLGSSELAGKSGHLHHLFLDFGRLILLLCFLSRSHSFVGPRG